MTDQDNAVAELLAADTDTPTESTAGTFLVTHADDASAVLKEVHDGQVHTLASNPGVAVDDVIEGAVSPVPPLETSWQLVAADARRQLSLEQSEEPPTTHEKELAADQPVGELTKEPRAGTGELHIITVPESETEAAVEDVVDDREATLLRAARLGVNRVEIRSAPGVVSVRYLP